MMIEQEKVKIHTKGTNIFNPICVLPTVFN